MKFSRSTAEGAIGVLILIILAAVVMIAIDEKLSKQLDKIDMTWEEMNK